MKNKSGKTFIATLIWAGLTICPFSVGEWAFAQGTTAVHVETSSDLKIKDSRDGHLLVVVFKDGVPASGVAIKTPRGVLSTNSEGVMTVDLAPDMVHKLEVRETGQEINVRVVSDEESQVIINLLTDKKTEVAVEAPTAAPTSQVPVTGPKHPVSFRVTAADGKPLADATVLFGGVDSVFKTDGDGRVIAELPEGSYSASVFHPNYQTQTLSNVRASREETGARPVVLAATDNRLEEMVVLAPKIKGSFSALVEVRKQSSAVTDVLGAEQMARAGDADAGSSLRRVTGLTLVGGKYVYVRGLGERYSSVQMNSFSLPSPEPSRRVVPLDLFPTAIMESIVVQKSYSPDLPGEFGGGVIELKTRSLPDKFFFRGNLSMNYENVDNRLDYKGGSTDWLGIDDGGRELPGVIKTALSQGKILAVNSPGFTGGVSQADLTQMGKSLPDNYDTSRTSEQSLPGFSISTGNGWKISGAQVGTSASLLYGQNTEQIAGTQRTFNTSDGALQKDSERTLDTSRVETRLAGSYDVGLELFKKHKLTASTFLLRNTSKFTQIEDIHEVSPPNTRDVTMAFTERQLWTRHFKGEHDLTSIVHFPLQVDWRVGWADATRKDPDRLEMGYFLNDDGSPGSLLSDQSGNTRLDSRLTDTTQEQALNFAIPLSNSTREVFKMKFGVMALQKDRRSDTSRLYFAGPASGTPDQVFGDANVGPQGVTLKNIASEADSYKGTQKVSAQYGMVEATPWAKWTFQAGLRRETSDQNVDTFFYTKPGVPSALSSIQMTDLLPAYGVVYKPTEKIRARLAYSETLARPDFREMSTVGFIDEDTGYIVQGNPNLKGTVIKNIDHRWEYYFTSDEYVSAGVFYKKFENPIEVIFIPGVNRIQSFANATGANNVGAELEGRVGLRNFSRTLRRWTVLSNITLINSKISLDSASNGNQTSAERPLQGQSPYAINMQLQYDMPSLGLTSTLLYNIVGKRITEVGTNGIPDTYEQSFGQLDLVASRVIQNNWTVSVRARNLLDPDVKSTQADEVVRSYRRGRVFGLSLGAVF